MQINLRRNSIIWYGIRNLLAGCLLAALFTSGCGGGQSNAVPVITTPTPHPTRTPRPQQSLFIGSYTGSYTTTFPPASPISGTRTGAFNFTVRTDGSVVFANGATSPTGQPSDGTGRCDLNSGRITWNSGLTFGFGIRRFSGQLTATSNDRVTGNGTVDYVEQSEFAAGPWTAIKTS